MFSKLASALGVIDLRPLRRRDFSLLFIGQMVSSFGSMITYVALPYQVYHLTQSSFAVGMMGVFELVPLLLTAFLGGALADSMDRRKLLLGSELALALCAALLAANALLPEPSIVLIFAMGALMSALNGIHRPALTALTPRLVSREEIPAVSALSSLRGNIAMIGGPAIGGICIASFGLPVTFGVDALTYFISLIALAAMRSIPQPEKIDQASFQGVLEGLKYARSRQELIGTYVVDFIAMVFGMPMALFPAIAENLGGARVLGWLYAAPAVGALVATFFSDWARRFHRHGAGVIIGASIWGIAIVAFGFATHYLWALFFLAVAGAADMFSAHYRNIIWNETIPDRLRGRMAGIEMISYMSGPLLGNAEAGLVAGLAGVRFSIVSGGFLCLGGVLLCIPLMPKLWKYDSREFKPL